MRSDLGGSVTPTQGAQAFPGGSARRWGVLGRESDEHGWNEVRQERGQWPGQVCLGGFGMRDGQRDRGRRVCSGAEASGMWSQGQLSGSWGQGHAGASQNTDVPCSRTEMRRAPNRRLSYCRGSFLMLHMSRHRFLMVDVYLTPGHTSLVTILFSHQLIHFQERI